MSRPASPMSVDDAPSPAEAVYPPDAVAVTDQMQEATASLRRQLSRVLGVAPDAGGAP